MRDSHIQYGFAKLDIPNDIEPLFPARVVAGTAPMSTGMHLGHYFGMVQQCTNLQYQYPGDTFCVIADYHALTWRQPAPLSDAAQDLALDYLALGLDPGVSTLYRQSDVPQVCELMWILGCAARVAPLERAHSYRESVHKGHTASLGLLLSPALLAADILMLRATDVPLDSDQEPILEMVREIGRSFNRRWQEVFPLPHLRRPPAPTIRGTDGRKMSAGYGNQLPVFWTDEDDFDSRVMHMVTGPASLGEPIDPESCLVFSLYRLVAGQELTEVMQDGLQRGQLGYREAKRMLLKALRSYFGPYHERQRQLRADRSMVEDVLQAGARHVREEAEATLDAVRECIGLGSHRRRFV